MENTGFKNKFINHFADESNSRFKADSVRQHIEAIAASVAGEIPQHFQHWSASENRSDYWNSQFMLSTYQEWVTEVDKIKEFTDNRIPYLSNHFINYFGLNGTHTLTLNINNTAAGSVQLNSLTLTDSTWEGVYYDNIPISIEAVASDGFVFSHWVGITGQSGAALELVMTDDMTLEAVFVAE